MALEINSVIIGGNLTRDVILKDTTGGRRVCLFSLANDRTYSGAGGRVKETSFINVEAWGATAENCGRYLHKGSPVVVSGRLKQSRWETPEGEKRSRLKVVALSAQFLSFSQQDRTDEASSADENMPGDSPNPVLSPET